LRIARLGLIVRYWHHLRASYWFIPAIMVVTALLLAYGMGRLDAAVGTTFSGESHFLMASRPEGARAVLAAIAGSMITVAGVTFSMTMVSVSFAAAQFGPRLIGNFMRDTGNQVTLGVFIATFTYSLFVLRTVRGADPGHAADAVSAFVPHLSISVALAMALACVGVLIYFVHHVPEAINVGNITAAVGRQLKSDIATLFPDSIARGRANRDDDIESLVGQPLEAAAAVHSDCDGYVESVDAERLITVAIEHDLVVRLEYRPGDFAVAGDTLLFVWPAARCGDQVRDALQSIFTFAVERTPEQNILFLVDELVEILARALSPGVNDPFTAIGCIHWLHGGLREAATRRSPDAFRFDEGGALRVIAHPVSFDRFLNAVVDQSLQYVSADRNASLETMRMLADVALLAPDQAKRASLVAKAEGLLAAADTRLPLEVDRLELRRRFEELKSAIGDTDTALRLRDNQGWLGGRA
jgi:uncharacterized membrane protein